MRKIDFKRNKTKNGITLMALIITIVLIFIFLAIIISVYNNGKVINTAQESTDLHIIAKEKENIKLAYQAEEIRRRDTGEPITAESFGTELKKMSPNTVTTDHEDDSTLNEYEVVVDRTDATGYADVNFLETGHMYIVALIDDAIQYTVTFDPNGGSGGPDIQKKVEKKNLTISSKEPTRNGYNFIGWGLDKNSTTPSYVGGDQYTEDADLRLYAIWQVKTYYITYDLDGGNDPKNPTRYNMFSDSFILKNPTKQLFIFKGWIGTDLSEPTKIVTIPQGSTGDRKYTATWDIPNYIIGDTKLSQTLKEAEELAEDGETIKVMRDVKDDSVASITKNVVLDLFGNTITMSNSINITQTGTLKIQDSGKENEYTGKILNTKTTAIINNGTLQLGNNDGTILISPTIQSATLGIDTKGIFKYYDGRVIGKTAIYGDTVETPTDYYAMAEVDSAEELETVELRTLGSAVCKIGFRYYSTIQEAVDAVAKGIQNEKKTIVMLVNLTVVDPVEMENKNLGLELAGKVITLSHEIHNTGILELTDSSAEQTGRLIFAEQGTGSVYAKGINNEGTFKLTSGQIENQKPYVNIVNNSNNGTVEIAGGTIKIVNSYVRGVYTELGPVSMTGGEINYNSDNKGNVYGLYNTGENEINIAGGTINLTSYYDCYGVYNTNGGNTKITAGEIITKMTYHEESYSIFNGNNGTVEITGGSIQGSSINNSSSYTSIYVIYNSSNGLINIKGGDVQLNLSSSITWYYGIYNNSTGTVNIEDSTIRINEIKTIYKDGMEYAIYNREKGIINVKGIDIEIKDYGIYNLAGTINIEEGTVKATGTNGQGIYNKAGTVTIGKAGGGVSITEPEIVGGKYGLYNGTGNIYFYDGVLKGKNEASFGSYKGVENNYYIIDDYFVDENQVEYKVKYLIPVGSSITVATIGDVNYTSLQDAILACTVGNEVITMQKNISIDEEDAIVIDSSKNITINLNGKHININSTTTPAIQNNGTLIIKDSSSTDYGTIQNNSGIAIQNSGTLSVGVNDGIISLAAPRIIGGTTAIQNTGTLNYYDGIISGTKAVDGTINEVATGYSYSTATNNNVQTITLKLTELDVKYTVNNFDITITGTGVSTVLDPNGDVHAADDTNSINFTFTATKSGTYIFRVTSSKGNIKVITVII